MENTDTVLSLDLLHDDVQQDECPRTTHPSTAVDQQWLVVGDGVQFTDVTDEGNEGHDVVWHSVIRPGRVVEMSHCHVLRVCLRQLHIRERVATNRVGWYKLTFSSLSFLNSYSANGMLEEKVTRNLSSTVRESFTFSGKYLAHFTCQGINKHGHANMLHIMTVEIVCTGTCLSTYVL